MPADPLHARALKVRHARWQPLLLPGPTTFRQLYFDPHLFISPPLPPVAIKLREPGAEEKEQAQDFHDPACAETGKVIHRPYVLYLLMTPFTLLPPCSYFIDETNSLP